MTQAWRPGADALVRDLRGIFSERLRSVVVYGSHAEDSAGDGPVTCLALVSTLGLDDLNACARATHAWHRRGLATPLILPEDEFRRSLDAFPLEYSEILRAHASLYGDDPFAGLRIALEDLRRACETQVKSHLLHLREEFIEAAGRPHAVAELVQASAPALAALLRNVARLHGVTTSDRIAATREGARLAGLADGIVADVLALEQPASVPATDPARLFPEYLAAVERLAKFVDGWRA